MTSKRENSSGSRGSDRVRTATGDSRAARTRKPLFRWLISMIILARLDGKFTRDRRLWLLPERRKSLGRTRRPTFVRRAESNFARFCRATNNFRSINLNGMLKPRWRYIMRASWVIRYPRLCHAVTGFSENDHVVCICCRRRALLAPRSFSRKTANCYTAARVIRSRQQSVSFVERFPSTYVDVLRLMLICAHCHAHCWSRTW